MAWKIELTPSAVKNLDQLDRQIARRILEPVMNFDRVRELNFLEK